MKISFRVRPELLIEIEERNQKDVFKALAEAQEVFGEKCCDKCKSNDIKFVVRENKDEDKFYELVCQKCGARLSFGCHKKGDTLFPKRREEGEDGKTKWLNNKGWLKWNKEKGVNE
jgi:hypothetical protein